MVIETLQPTESRIINDVAQLQRMIDEIGSNALKPALDTVAMAVAGESVADYGRAFGTELAHVHFIDGTPDGHLAWGDGDLPMERYLDELADIGYIGHLGLEVINFQYWSDPTAALRQAVERIRSALTPAANTAPR